MKKKNLTNQIVEMIGDLNINIDHFDLQHYIESLKRDMFEISSIKSNLYNLRQHEIKTVYKAQVE